jgi:hypothetical protein
MIREKRRRTTLMTRSTTSMQWLADFRKLAMYSFLLALAIAIVPALNGQHSVKLFKSHYEAVRQL